MFYIFWEGLCDHFKMCVIVESHFYYFLHVETVYLWNCVSTWMHMHLCVYSRVHICECVCTQRYLNMAIVCLILSCFLLKDRPDVCFIRPSNWGILIYCEIFMLIGQGAGLCSMFALALGGRHSNYSRVLVFCLLSWLWDLLYTPSQMESVSGSLVSVIHCCYTQELLRS